MRPQAFWLSVISSLPSLTIGHLLRHEALDAPRERQGIEIEKRQGYLPPSRTSYFTRSQGFPVNTMGLATPLPPPTYAWITTSPGASAVPLTKQSQVFTFVEPLWTLCSIGIGTIDIRSNVRSSMTRNAAATPMYRNVSSPAGARTTSRPEENTSCQTFYNTTASTVCSTTLRGLATRHTVTRCSQDITFSSQHGYQLVQRTPLAIADKNNSATTTIFPDPVVATYTTYYVAPWQTLTDPGEIPEEVLAKVCHANNEEREGEQHRIYCENHWEAWHVNRLAWYSATTRKLFDTYIPAPTSGFLKIYDDEGTEMYSIGTAAGSGSSYAAMKVSYATAQSEWIRRETRKDTVTRTVEYVSVTSESKT